MKPEDSDIGSGNVMPTALIDGYPINEDEFRDLTAETSGRLILNEMAIDMVLARRLDEAGLVVGDADVARERQALLDSLDDDGGQAVRLVRELRKRRSLGSRRFDNLMRRNAGLRMLVRDDVDISDSIIGPYATISKGSKISESIIKDSIIGENSEITASLLENSIIGNNTLIKGSYKKLNTGDSTEIEIH